MSILYLEGKIIFWTKKIFSLITFPKACNFFLHCVLHGRINLKLTEKGSESVMIQTCLTKQRVTFGKRCCYCLYFQIFYFTSECLAWLFLYKIKKCWSVEYFYNYFIGRQHRS